MAAYERSIRKDFKYARKEFALEAMERRVYDNDAWSWKYVRFLEERLMGTLLSWESWKAVYGDLEGTDEWSRAEHSHRRIVAMCDEEIVLHEQGRDVAMAAHHFNKTVSSGCWCVYPVDYACCACYLIHIV